MTTLDKIKGLFQDYNEHMEHGIFPRDLDHALEVIKDIAPTEYNDAYQWAIDNPQLTMME